MREKGVLRNLRSNHNLNGSNVWERAGGLVLYVNVCDVMAHDMRRRKRGVIVQCLVVVGV